MTRSPDRSIALIVPGDPNQRTGGYIYDRRLAEALDARGWNVRLHALEGRFPLADERARNSARDLLQRLPEGMTAVIDGLALGGLPEVMAEHRQRLRLVALIHHPLADESGLGVAERRRLFESERAALAAVSRVAVTSRFTAECLSRYGVSRERVVVAEPGTDSAPLATGNGDTEPMLLCVGAVIPRKGQDVLVQALDRVRDLHWRCRCVGSLNTDPDFAASVLAARARLRLEDRIALNGERDTGELAQAYDSADLMLHPARYEGYGMALCEALARGLPVISTTGGAIPGTVPDDAGLLVEPGKAEALAGAIRRVLTDTPLRTRLGEGARAARQRLPGWDITAARFEAVLKRETGT